MPQHRFEKMSAKFNTVWQNPKQAAKWWACHEAIIKCLGSSPDWKISKIEFPQGKAPIYIGKEQIVLSLSHEGDLVTAIAMQIGKP